VVKDKPRGGSFCFSDMDRMSETKEHAEVAAIYHRCLFWNKGTPWGTSIGAKVSRSALDSTGPMV